jgi:hypothetical protein
MLVGFSSDSRRPAAISSQSHWEPTARALCIGKSVDPPYFQSLGTSDGDPLDFAYDGHYTEVPATSLIDRDAALRALAEFVETDRRPESVEWLET